MQLPEFEDQFRRLRLTYGEKVFPVEREKLFFDRYKRMPAPAFKAAIDQVILTLPIPSLVLGVIDETIGKNRPKTSEGEAHHVTHYECEPCRDYGYGFVGDTVVRCTCRIGESVGQDEIDRQQASYDRGRELLKRGALRLGRALPYDQKERIG